MFRLNIVEKIENGNDWTINFTEDGMKGCLIKSDLVNDNGVPYQEIQYHSGHNAKFVNLDEDTHYFIGNMDTLIFHDNNDPENRVDTIEMIGGKNPYDINNYDEAYLQRVIYF